MHAYLTKPLLLCLQSWNLMFLLLKLLPVELVGSCSHFALLLPELLYVVASKSDYSARICHLQASELMCHPVDNLLPEAPAKAHD